MSISRNSLSRRAGIWIVMLALALLPGCAKEDSPPAPERGAASPKLGEWRRIEVAAPPVSFEMPVEPSHTKESVHSTVGMLELETYAINSVEGSEMQATFSVIPSGGDPKAVLAGARKALIAGDRGRVIKEEAIELDGAPGLLLEFDVVARNARVLARLHVVDGVLCQLIAVPAKGSTARADAERFIGSLEIHR